MAQLRLEYNEFTNLDTEILVIGPENQQAFQRYWDNHSLPFIGIPNPDHSVLKRFGQEVNLFKLGRMPAQVIVDKQGVARYAHYGKSMQDIPENDELMTLLEKINGPVMAGFEPEVELD